MDKLNLVDAKFRRIGLGFIPVQIGLITIFLLLSIRSVWPLINNTIEKSVGIGENSFVLVFSLLLFLEVISLVIVFYHFRMRRKRKPYSKISLIYLAFHLLLNVILLAQLWPNLYNMYLSQIPYWLFKEGFLPFALFIISVLLFLVIKKNRVKRDLQSNFLLFINAMLLLTVLCFVYIAGTVRSREYDWNKLENKKEDGGSYFSINSKNDNSRHDENEKIIFPEISIPLDQEYGGEYLSAGDLTGDSIVEIVSTKYWVEPNDVNRIKSIAVQSMLADSISGERGEIVWTWESSYPAPDIGNGRGSSAAIAVFDLQTGKPNKKLLFATDGWLYEYTFEKDMCIAEKRVPTGSVASSDCMVIANLDGKGKHHLLLKDAYHTIWAYDKDLNLVWKKKKPGGYLLAHRIAACDMDGDGKDEIIAGATILNQKGEVTATLQSNSVKLWYGGHIDGIVPIRQGADWFISVTYCDGLGIALFDSSGACIWETMGEHFEYLVGGYFFNTPDLKNSFQLISKVHYDDENPQLMINQDGRVLGEFKPSSAVFSVDWTGDGYHELVFLSPVSIYSGTKRIANVSFPGNAVENVHTLRVVDMIGKINLMPDGIPDLAIRSVDKEGRHSLNICPNIRGKKPSNYVYPGIGWESSANYFTKYFDYQ